MVKKKTKEKQIDPRIKKLAKVLVDYSIAVKCRGLIIPKKGDAVKISSSVLAKDLILEIYRLVLKKGMYPSVNVGLPGMSKIYYENASDEQLKHFPKMAMYETKRTQAYIGIDAPKDTRDLAHINPKKLAMREKVTHKLSDYIVNEQTKIRRVSTDFPTKALAKDAGMSLKEFEDLLYGATNIDWNKEKKRLYKIEKLFHGGKEVRIVGKNTDITLGIKGRKFVIDAGEENMPGGEMFCAPLETKTNGKILFTYPSIRDGRKISGIYLEFKDGQVVKAKASQNEDYLKEMLKIKGAKIVGELGIGCNTRVKRYTNDLLFDEKIGGTIHLALGMSYKECKGTNGDAAIHWDIVKDLRKGGTMYVDGKVIQKNGKWIF